VIQWQKDAACSYERSLLSAMLAGQIAFFVLAAAAIGSGIGVIAFRNAVYSALSLIVNLFCLALFFLMLNAIFIATIQVLVYAGAIMVLFLFVVTMLSPGDDEGLPTRDRIAWQRAAAVGLGVILAGAISYTLLSQVSLSPDAMATGAADLGTQIATQGNTEAFGLALFHGYLFPFEVTSVILVAAIVGAVVLGRRTSSKEAE
jgi:NADH-quinone oxidoreductase subunit J